MEQQDPHAAPGVHEGEDHAGGTADAIADAKGILVIFIAIVAFAVHFASGWTFDWTYDLF